MPYPRFYLSYRTLISYGRTSGLPLYLPGNQAYARMKNFDVIIALLLIYKVFCYAYTIVIVDKFEVRMYVFSALVYALSGVLLNLFFGQFGQRFRNIVAQVDSLTERLLRSGFGHEDLLIRNYQAAASWISRFSNMMFAVAILCPTFYCVSAPFMDFLEGNYRNRTAVPGQCPFELVIQKLPGVFELIVLQQVFVFFAMSTIILVTECLMLGFFRIQCSFFTYLAVTLRDIGDNMAHGNRSNKEFIGWIKLHQDVLKNGYELSSYFSPVIVVYYISTIIEVVGPLPLMLDRKSVNMIQTVFGTMAMLSNLFQLFLQCHYANEVTSEGEKLAFGAYSMPWTGFGREDRGLVRQIITICNQPIYVEGYRCPAFRLDRPTYQAMFLSTLSTFMAFQKIKEMNELEDI